MTKKPEDRGHFAQTPMLLLKDKREGITSYTLAVYAAIHSYADFGKTVGAYPTTKQIAERAHCSTATVERERELLKELGYLTWVPGNFKRHEGNAYTLFPSNRWSIDRPNRGSIDHPTDGNRGLIDHPTDGLFPSNRGLIDHPTDGTQRTSTENQTERYRGKTALCSHSDTAFCSHCLTATAPSRDHVNTDDEDF